MFDWFTTAVDWLAQWAPRPVATAILLSVLWFAVVVPAIKLTQASSVTTSWRRIPRQNQIGIVTLFIAGAAFLMRGASIGFIDFIVVGAAALLAGGGLTLWQHHNTKKVAALQGALWRTTPATHPDFPIISWHQLVDTGLQHKDAINRFEFNFMRATLMAGPVAGWVLGGGEGALIGLALAWLLLPGVNRYAIAPKPENVNGWAPMLGKWTERQPTELERQIEAEPVTEEWEAQAYVDTIDRTDIYNATPYLTVQWRNPATGEIRCQCCEKWESLSGFEFDAHDRFFATPAAPRKYRSPLVIIARNSTGHLIELARDISRTDHLQPIFKRLDEAFGPARCQEFQAERDRKRRRIALDERPPQEPQDPETQPVRQKPIL